MATTNWYQCHKYQTVLIARSMWCCLYWRISTSKLRISVRLCTCPLSKYLRSHILEEQVLRGGRLTHLGGPELKFSFAVRLCTPICCSPMYAYLLYAYVRIFAIRLFAVRLFAVRLFAVCLFAVRLFAVRPFAVRLFAVHLFAIRLFAVTPICWHVYGSLI